VTDDKGVPHGIGQWEMMLRLEADRVSRIGSSMAQRISACGFRSRASRRSGLARPSDDLMALADRAGMTGSPVS
jgi:hypothetical protein